ncbi:MAG: hypothetical protein ACRC1P_05535 [Cellulosilyticaceae bacterium]
MSLNKDKNIKRTPLLDLYIQRTLAEQMKQLDEEILVLQMMKLLKDKESESKNLSRSNKDE